MHHYSIIIPVHNELKYIPDLVEALKAYSNNNHEIIIIDDGSNDGSTNILCKYKFLKLITHKNNKGKGKAIKKGLEVSCYERIVIFDGDMELHPSDISKLMILDRQKNINSVFGYRFSNLNPIKSSLHWGNFIFTTFFNLTHMSCHKDILCCAKSFFKKDIIGQKIQSNGFDIDVELASILTMKHKYRKIHQVLLHYKRRSILDGKKLKISDGWTILRRMISLKKIL